jgi:glucose-6-phosphate-specific signal transduction histidine kinase
VTFLHLLPALLSLLVLGAHFLRAGNLLLLGVALGLMAILLVRRWWAARAVQVALLLGMAEWARTLVELAGARARAGEPYARLVAILAGVALATGLSALALRTGRARRWFGCSDDTRPEPGARGDRS